MTLQETLVHARRRLSDADLDEADVEAEILLRHAMDLSRSEFFASLDRPLTPHESSHLSTLLDRRIQREPLAYITGTREFFGLDFAVDPRVLIPRQETELLVEKALELAGSSTGGGMVFADVGTGSGAIAVAIAHALPEATVYATDVSSDALAVAEANCRAHRVSSDPDRVRLLSGDLLEALPGPVDVIVSNPPYISHAGYADVAPEVRQEPVIALDGGPDGLDVVRRLFEQAPGRLRPGGRLIVEISPEQLTAVGELAKEFLPGARVTWAEDLLRLPRAVIVET